MILLAAVVAFAEPTTVVLPASTVEEIRLDGAAVDGTPDGSGYVRYELAGEGVAVLGWRQRRRPYSMVVARGTGLLVEVPRYGLAAKVTGDVQSGKVCFAQGTTGAWQVGNATPPEAMWFEVDVDDRVVPLRVRAGRRSPEVMGVWVPSPGLWTISQEGGVFGAQWDPSWGGEEPPASCSDLLLPGQPWDEWLDGRLAVIDDQLASLTKTRADLVRRLENERATAAKNQEHQALIEDIVSLKAARHDVESVIWQTWNDTAVVRVCGGKETGSCAESVVNVLMPLRSRFDACRREGKLLSVVQTVEADPGMYKLTVDHRLLRDWWLGACE